MDGASKFVRGDVVASLMITAINIIGGLIIGTMQQGMGIAEAAELYTVLTIGDGLISQIPALLISTGAGILVSRAASEANLSEEMSTQVLGNPKTVMIAAAFIFLIGMMPGLPAMPFWTLSGIFVFVALKNYNAEEKKNCRRSGGRGRRSYRPQTRRSRGELPAAGYPGAGNRVQPHPHD